jgi:2,4-dienoyl-CoA reductase-like NADH-dependent reductase (Old Yellow Enzyme family)
MKETGLKENGYPPYIVMQANHSGRYSRPGPEGKSEPIIAFNNPVIEGNNPIDSSRIASDEYLMTLEEKFGEAAELCRQVGFDAVDIKSCHGYLIGELAGAFTREGNYGGSFENRFRLLLNSVRNAKHAETDEFAVVVRLNIFDGFVYPYGYGTAQDDRLTPNYDEPLRAINLLHHDLGVPMINITMGDPHIIPYITRPFQSDDKFTQGENPLAGVARMYKGTGAIKHAFPSLVVSASAPSYLRQFAPNLAAGAIQEGICDLVCFGRLAFANPNFPRDIKEAGMLRANNACLTCSKCSSLGRAGVPAGCVIHDKDIYMPYYKELIKKG